MSKSKLSPKQIEVLKLMGEGWELGEATSATGGAWLQKNGLGRGGETVRVNTNTLYSLYFKKLIKQHYSFPNSIYTLTDAGKQALNELEVGK